MKQRRNRSLPLTPESVTFTSQLLHRPCHAPNLLAENQAFHDLAENLVLNPAGILRRLAEITLKLCDADTVGISVEETDGLGKPTSRWVAMAGESRGMLNGSTPRNGSPSGLCIDQRQPLLMRDLALAYPYFRDAPRPFVEALLLPWGVPGGPQGTLWVVTHSDRRNFDLQDVRVLGSLAAFAFGAIYLKQKVQDAERIAAATRLTSAMAHHINNPLQAALLLLFRLKSENSLSDTALGFVSVLESEMERVVALSSEVIGDNSGAHYA